MLTELYVGLNPVTPHLVAGETIDPKVSVPTEKPTRPAEVADADPAEEPLDPWDKSQGFNVFPPNQTSPLAKDPVESFPNIIAPAFSNLVITSALSLSIWFFNGIAPHVVGCFGNEARSFIP